MKPIQLWLPTVLGGVRRPECRRDMERMFKVWRTKHVMWSVPDWAGPPNWFQRGLRVSCLNGENLECVRILHIGANGAIVGPAAASLPNQNVNGLLDAWLKLEFGPQSAADPDESLELQIPFPVGGAVTYVKANINIPVTNVLPFAHIGDDGYVAAQWPPKPGMPSTVSPEMESALDSPGASPPKGTIRIRLALPSPFDLAQPLILTPDDIHARSQMRAIEALSKENIVEARSRPEIEAREWLSEGHSTVERTLLQPIISAEDEEGARSVISTRLGVEVNSLEQAYKSKKLGAKLRRQLPVRRAWGVPGLMWALLLDRLEAGQPFRTCESCGRRIAGKAGKRYCGPGDNEIYYRARKKSDKRRTRSRKD